VFGVHDQGPVLSFVPIILIGVLFGPAVAERDTVAEPAGGRRG
jgi:hypothetical protein